MADEEEEATRTLVVRAIDGEWIMGDDLVLTVTGDETIVEIQQARGIAARRESDTAGSL